MDEFIIIFLYNKKHLILVRLLFVFCFLYFQLQYNEVVEMVEAVLSQLVEYQSSLMATTILHDAESQRWSDMRPFYEDERISHCIQMWWYYLQGLRHDLWSSLPPKAGRSIFAAVFDKVFNNLFVTSKIEFSKSPILEFKVMHKSQRAF